MLEYFRMFTDMWYRFLNVLDGIILDVGGLNVSYLDIVVGFILLGIVITVYWKGASSK